jgi:hypothetical protein
MLGLMKEWMGDWMSHGMNLSLSPCWPFNLPLLVPSTQCAGQECKPLSKPRLPISPSFYLVLSLPETSIPSLALKGAFLLNSLVKSWVWAQHSLSCQAQASFLLAHSVLWGLSLAASHCCVIIRLDPQHFSCHTLGVVDCLAANGMS